MRAMMKAIVTLALSSLILGQAAESSAFQMASASRNLSARHDTFIAEKSEAVGPFAHALFCAQNPGDCQTSRRTRWGRAPVVMTERKQQELRRINSEINAAIEPRNDTKVNGFGDSWTLAPKAGDCEDYAITKRHKLISLGWPARAVRLAITYTGSGEGHMVLVVRTSEGDLVLDNRIDTIRAWNKTGLKWKMMQASLDPRKWVGV